MKLVEEITQTEQNLKQTEEKNEFNCRTTITRTYLVNHQFPHHDESTLTIHNVLDIKKGIL